MSDFLIPFTLGHLTTGPHWINRKRNWTEPLKDEWFFPGWMLSDISIQVLQLENV